MAIPTGMLLLSRYRESGASAGRAALIQVGNYSIFESPMVNLVRDEASVSVCPHCGRIVPRVEFFCPNCGLGQA